jgi:hypothetical protein
MIEALREIHEVHANTITIHLPENFAQQVEVIVLPVTPKSPLTVAEQQAVYEQIKEFRCQLERSGRTFSDSVELIREGRGE